MSIHMPTAQEVAEYEAEFSRSHTIEEIRDHWLKNRSEDGSDWEKALGAVYDLGARSREIAEWHYLPAALPPECRIVLLLMSHQAEPVVMRKYALGSWRMLEGVVDWSIAGEARNFQEWGWYLIAWTSLPPAQELPETNAQAEE